MNRLGPKGIARCRWAINENDREQVMTKWEKKRTGRGSSPEADTISESGSVADFDVVIDEDWTA